MARRPRTTTVTPAPIEVDEPQTLRLRTYKRDGTLRNNAWRTFPAEEQAKVEAEFVRLYHRIKFEVTK